MNQHDRASGITGILHRESPAIRRANGPLHVCPHDLSSALDKALLSIDRLLTVGKNTRRWPHAWRPRAGQWAARKTALRRTSVRAVSGLDLQALPVCGPACARRAAKAEPGADAGPAAPQAPLLITGTLTIEVTRVVVDGRVIESDGKTENAQHVLALDPFTLAVLKAHVESLDQERRDFGPSYHDHGVLFCWEDGRPPHPDTITRRFKRLSAAAGLPEIDLHDVRHSYATVGRDARIDWKSLSKRIGHADVAFTMKQYVQTDLEADRQVANTLAELIMGGSLASAEITSMSREGQAATAGGDPGEAA